MTEGHPGRRFGAHALTCRAVTSGGVDARDGDDEQGVRTGTVFIQVGTGRRPVHMAKFKNLRGKWELAPLRSILQEIPCKHFCVGFVDFAYATEL